MKPIRCIRCKRPIKSGAVHRLGPECARILLVQLTAKKQPEPEEDKRQVDWVQQEASCQQQELSTA